MLDPLNTRIRIESQLGASNSDLSRKSSGDGGGKLRRSIRALKRGSGIEAVKDLWQQTGKSLNKYQWQKKNRLVPIIGRKAGISS